MKFIDREQLRRLGEAMQKNPYGAYLLERARKSEIKHGGYELSLEGLLLLKPNRFSDDRGFFSRVINTSNMPLRVLMHGLCRTTGLGLRAERFVDCIINITLHKQNWFLYYGVKSLM